MVLPLTLRLHTADEEAIGLSYYRHGDSQRSKITEKVGGGGKLHRVGVTSANAVCARSSCELTTLETRCLAKKADRGGGAQEAASVVR